MRFVRLWEEHQKKLAEAFNSLCEIHCLPPNYAVSLATFNSLCEIRNASFNALSSALPFSFNSLCEIRIMLLILHTALMIPFNSLCEIHLLMNKVLRFDKDLSILFVRFSGHFEKRSGGKGADFQFSL